MPARLKKQKPAPGMVEWMVPSISERAPPVIRLITLPISSGPVKVARSPVASENFSKLWNRSSPARVPIIADLELAAEADARANRAVGLDPGRDRDGDGRDQNAADPA